MLAATASESHESHATEAEPQATLFHQLNLQANALRRNIARPNAGRAEPVRLAKAAADN